MNFNQIDGPLSLHVPFTYLHVQLKTMGNSKTIKAFLIGCSTLWPVIACAQVDTISIKNNNLRTDYLTEGNSQYLSWLSNTKSGLVSNISIAERKVIFQKNNGRDVIVVTKRILNNDSSLNKYVYVVCNRSNFKMLYDFSRKANTIEAYDFQDNEIKGADTIKQNAKVNFYLKFNELPYCNELDLETITAVPVKKSGQKMAISFYQPGSTAGAKFYPLNVIGSEQLKGLNNSAVECWLLKLIFDKVNYDLFWVSKKTHELLKFESWGPGEVYSKVKLFNLTQNL